MNSKPFHSSPFPLKFGRSKNFYPARETAWIGFRKDFISLLNPIRVVSIWSEKFRIFRNFRSAEIYFRDHREILGNVVKQT
ncbi:MAG: hypothetical protein DRI57_16060 [Deltaproteobacteria bacterium]|nr:MAG: hypothetical protein DRI57_16060 [Deltaproteobacteria bacterium]